MKKKDKGDSGTGAAPGGQKPFSLISDETLIALYSNLLKCRLIGQRVGALLQQRGPKSTSALVRRTAPAIIAVARDLGPDDSLISLDNDLSTAFLRGTTLSALLHSDRELASTDAGRQLHEAVGEALIHKIRKDAKVTCIVSNEAESKQWLEALDAARIHGLPMIFVSQHMRAKQSRKQSKSDGVDEAYLPHIAVDGQDVVAAYRVAQESIARARLGRGPTLIECKPFDAKLPHEPMRDAVQNMETYLAGKDLIDRKMKKDMVKTFSAELDAAMKSSSSK